MKSNKNIIIPALVFVLLLIPLLNCERYRLEVIFDYQLFKQKQTGWNNLNIMSYSFDYDCYGFCYRYLHIVVKNDSVETVNGDVYHPSMWYVHTINELFNEIELCYFLSKDHTTGNDPFIQEFKIIYNDTFFFPESVKYISYIPEGVIVDGPEAWSIRNFKPDSTK